MATAFGCGGACVGNHMRPTGMRTMAHPVGTRRQWQWRREANPDPGQSQFNSTSKQTTKGGLPQSNKQARHLQAQQSDRPRWGADRVQRRTFINHQSPNESPVLVSIKTKESKPAAGFKAGRQAHTPIAMHIYMQNYQGWGSNLSS